jgi:hypothetical protein
LKRAFSTIEEEEEEEAIALYRETSEVPAQKSHFIGIQKVVV